MNRILTILSNRFLINDHRHLPLFANSFLGTTPTELSLQMVLSLLIREAVRW